MPNERKELFSKKGTGTVPKVKHRNNISHSNQPDFHRNFSNNYDLLWDRHDYTIHSRSSGRNTHQVNSYMMENSGTDHRHNREVADLAALTTASTSSSSSRRDSVGTIPKCDNVKKFPDKKHIEDKLNQIREYLQVTTSLMSSIKNNEDQSSVTEKEQFEKMIKDLKDSEAKLLALLDDPIICESSVSTEQSLEEENHNMDVTVSEHMKRFSQLLDIVACQPEKFNYVYNTNNEPIENGLDNISDSTITGSQQKEMEDKVEITNRKVQLLKEQQNALINLKRKAENQLRDARQTQENLLVLQQQQKAANELRKVRMDTDLPSNEAQLNQKNFYSTIKHLEERLNMMRDYERRYGGDNQLNEQDAEYFCQPEDSSTNGLHLLDNQNSQLNSEQLELQQKLTDLQSKKVQIDNIAEQLQTLGVEDDEDIGVQVRKIVTMKQQLSSLKDLLEIVKNTENSLNEVDDVQENCQSICAKTDNIRQDVKSNRNQNDNSNNAARSNEIWLAEKQSNKSLLKIQEREKLLVELKAKKRELEEIMYKRKDRTLINNDVCSETCFNKSEQSSNNNMFDNTVMSWIPTQSNRNQTEPTTYSSDECLEEDGNEFSDVTSTEVIIGSMPRPQPILSSSYSTSTNRKSRSGIDHHLESPSAFVRHTSPHLSTTERCMQSAPIVSSSMPRERAMPNSINEAENSKTQFQKQLELIQNVCQSLLEQQSSNSVHNGVQQLRNNLTPSPMYAEPRSYVPTNSRQTSSIFTENSPVDLSYLNTQPNNPQAYGELANNQNILAANTLQTQAFLLNTLNQCCQMLWYQQREIGTLHNLICTWQDQMIGGGQLEQDFSQVPLPPPTSYIYPPRPLSSLSNFRAPSQHRKSVNSKINQVSAACSMPNLNPLHSHANNEGAYLNQSNIRSNSNAHLLESSLNNVAPVSTHHNLGDEQPPNNTILPRVNINPGINQPLPSQIWNGQALNNQVAPGNRANNYWDNFRSYSRQNLLSTSSKSNEGLQNHPASESALHYNNTFSLPPLLKLNMVHNDSTTTSEERSPRRQLHFKTLQNLSCSNKPVAAIPPDVLNVNHNSAKRNEHVLMRDAPSDTNISESNLQLGTNGCSASNSCTFKDHTVESRRNRNEWHENEHSENLPKSKLFEELRDNVYKEVASLISANENRPHFLIQLFRDLHHINSDQLRGKTLQSIHTVITNSFSTLDNVPDADRQSGIFQVNSDQEVVQVDSEYYSLQPIVWPQSPVSTSRDSSNMDLEVNDDMDIHNILRAIFKFLKAHNSDFLDQNNIDTIKEIIVRALPFSYFVLKSKSKERSFQKHFPYVISDIFEKYKGKRISEISTDLLKTVSDVLLEEFSCFYLGQESVQDDSENTMDISSTTNLLLNDNVLSLNLQPQPTSTTIEDGSTPQMQNGDLAEADQSRIELQKEEEEGAVGGVINVLHDHSTNSDGTDIINPDVTEIAKIDFPTESEIEFVELGLDQVPTRLSTSRSQSNTPNKDCSSSSMPDPLEHY